jgi:hypothetical protein
MRKEFVIAAATFAAGTACAQSQMKPGLWEMSHTMRSASGQMEQQMAQAQQQMANMPPEQRKMMEEMMAKRGVKMGGGGPGSMTVKACVTKEMVERNEMPTQDRGDCKKTVNRSGNTVKMSFTCTNPPSTGEGQFTFSSPEAYTMKMVVNTQVQGRPETMNMEGTGKWLGADCGDIKPMRTPAK